MSGLNSDCDGEGRVLFSRNDTVGKVSAIWKELRSNQKTSDSAGSSRYIAQASHQTVPEFISMSTPGVAIPVGFTDQKLAVTAVSRCFWDSSTGSAFTRHSRECCRSQHVRTTPKAIPPADLALSFYRRSTRRREETHARGASAPRCRPSTAARDQAHRQPVDLHPGPSTSFCGWCGPSPVLPSCVSRKPRGWATSWWRSSTPRSTGSAGRVQSGGRARCLERTWPKSGTANKAETASGGWCWCVTAWRRRNAAPVKS